MRGKLGMKFDHERLHLLSPSERSSRSASHQPLQHREGDGKPFGIFDDSGACPGS